MSVYSFVIAPDTYTAFQSEQAQIEQCQSWGILSEKASKSKSYLYKANGQQLTCHVVGYVDPYTAVIEFDDQVKHCIHPSYLKEMQSASFEAKFAGQSNQSVEAETDSDAGSDTAVRANSAVTSAVTSVVTSAEITEVTKADPKATEGQEPPAKAKRSSKAAKLQLPEDKVRMTATVQEFTTVPNHFADTDDEVVIYESVSIVDPVLDVGVAWSSYSATLKKLELQIGDTISFDAKIVAKKLTKHPVPYKINNPSKITKL